MSNDANPDGQQPNLNVVVKTKRDIPVNAVILLICTGLAFYGGFKLGGISLQTLLDASNAANQSYMTEIQLANDSNQALAEQLSESLDQIREEQQHLIEQAQTNIENSLENARKYEVLITDTLAEISALKASVSQYPDAAVFTQKLNSLEQKLGTYRTNRLVNVCKNVPLVEVALQ